jgi:DNA-binding response OmpR family regulator
MTRILIVEDEPAILLGLSGQLRREGYEVLTSTNGDDGLQTALTQKPALILLDLMLPAAAGMRSAGPCAPVAARHRS